VNSRGEADESASGAGQDAALSVIATLASVALGANPVAATLVGGSAPVVKFVQQLWAQAGKRRGDRASRALERAAGIMDVGIDIIAERSAAHDGRLELLARILEAAARSSMEEKIDVLGQVLADGLRDDSHLDEARLLASMIDDLEAPHVMVLKRIAEQPVPPKSMWTNEVGPRGWERTHLTLVLPEYTGIVDGLLAVLVGHGALRTLGDATWDGQVNNYSHGITPLGERCLLLFGHEQADSRSTPGGVSESA
jgi:hypothetical protein